MADIIFLINNIHEVCEIFADSAALHEKSLQTVRLQTLHILASLEDAFRLYIFSDDEFLESGDMHVGSFSGRVGIAACDRFEYHTVFLRHVLGSLEVIVIYVTKSEDQLLELFDHLYEDLVIA